LLKQLIKDTTERKYQSMLEDIFVNSKSLGLEKQQSSTSSTFQKSKTLNCDSHDQTLQDSAMGPDNDKKSNEQSHNRRSSGNSNQGRKINVF
jgi:hypothetical protein